MEMYGIPEPYKSDNHLKHDHAGQDGKCRKHHVVNWWYDSSVKCIQSLQACIKISENH